MQRRIASSGLLRRDRCHKEREATIDHASEARLGDDNSPRDEAKWQEDHGSVAAFFINSHGTTIGETSRCGNGVTIAECGPLYRRSGGTFWQDAWLGKKLVMMMQLGSTVTKKMTVVKRDRTSRLWRTMTVTREKIRIRVRGTGRGRRPQCNTEKRPPLWRIVAVARAGDKSGAELVE